MDAPIVNKVAASKLQVIDLEDFYRAGSRSIIDIAPWLLEGLVLVESRFRESVKNTDFTAYKDHYVVLQCSTDAIIPQWAWMLLATQLAGIAQLVIKGTLEELETLLYTEDLNELDLTAYENKPVIIKGCGNLPVPITAYTQLTALLKPIATSIMYGEACSAVPVYKKPRVK